MRGELTLKTFRLHYDFPIDITERFRMKDDGETLEYEFHISGLGNERYMSVGKAILKWRQSRAAFQRR